MQYIACCRHLCTLLAFCSSSKSGGDNTATSPRPLYQHQIPEIRLPIRMPTFDFKKYWIYVTTNQSLDRFGKQITLCESLSSFSQFLPVPDTGLLNPTSLRKPLNSACTTLHKPLKTPIRCLSTTLILRNPGQRRLDFNITFRTDLFIKVYRRILSADYTVISILPSANPLNAWEGFSVIGGNVPAVCGRLGLSTRCDFISINECARDKRMAEYAVDAPAAV